MAELATTELEAVNIMLGTMGEASVSTLAGTLPAEVANAVSILSEVSRDVQSVGREFNTEYEVTLEVDGDSKIPTPPNALKVDVSDIDSNYYTNVTQRGGYLYNKSSHTYIFTKPLRCDVVYFLPFTDLPEAARRYITIKAARIFQDRYLGSQTLGGFTKQEEMDAKWKMEEAETNNADYTIFDSSGIGNIIWRRR